MRKATQEKSHGVAGTKRDGKNVEKGKGTGI
jgi:hypothetical protein